MVDRRKLKPPSPVQRESSTGEARIVDIRPTAQDVVPAYDSELVRDKARVDFREEEFTRAIRQKGYFVTWRKALLCPCANSETEQAAMNCDVCDGSGYFYVDPHDIQAIMTGFTRRQNVTRHKPGLWLQGETQVTVEPQYRIGFRDSFELKDSVGVFNEWICKGNRRGIRAKLPDGVDSARYRIVKVGALYYLDANKTPVRLEENLHFKLTSDGWIEWTGEGNKVPDGTVFSVHYDFHPVYVVDSHPHTLRDTVTAKKRAEQTVINLPLQGSVLLDYLLDVNKPLPVTGGC